MTTGLGLIPAFAYYAILMEILPNDCIFELMKSLGPANVQFMQVNKRILGIFEQNRAKLEHLCARVAIIEGPSELRESVELSNSLYPNKKMFIETHDFHFWRDSYDGKYPFRYKYVEMNVPSDIWNRFIDKSTTIWYCNASMTSDMLYSIRIYENCSIEKYFVCGSDIVKMKGSIWLSGSYPFWCDFEVSKLSDKLIIMEKIGKEMWRFDYDDYARICKHIFKFSEIPPKIFELYQTAINLIIRELGLPGI